MKNDLILKHYTADLNDDGWEQVRELAEDFIRENKFDADPLKCVINAYVTLLMIEKERDDFEDLNQIH